jgi:HNH endonuclease
MRVYPAAKGSVTPYGYRRFRRQRFEHVLVWESRHGPVPDGCEIHHRNGDKLDNRIENLQLVTRLEHKRIHSGCVRFGATWLKKCRRCQWFRPVDAEYYVYPGRNGVMGVCRRCAVEMAVEAKKRRRDKSRASLVQVRRRRLTRCARPIRNPPTANSNQEQ